MNAVALPESRESEGGVRLHGSSDAPSLARAALASRPLAVFCARATDAQRLKDEIAWFAPQLAVLLLPDWETLPYDHFSPHHDLVSERLATLYRIMREDFDVALVPAPTALARLAPPSYLAGRSFFIKTGTALDLAALRSQLALAGYSHVTQVYRFDDLNKPKQSRPRSAAETFGQTPAKTITFDRPPAFAL